MFERHGLQNICEFAKKKLFLCPKKAKYQKKKGNYPRMSQVLEFFGFKCKLTEKYASIIAYVALCPELGVVNGEYLWDGGYITQPPIVRNFNFLQCLFTKTDKYYKQFKSGVPLCFFFF